MSLEVKVPSPGESITEVEIASWTVSSGDIIEKDQTIAEIESDKATLEIVAEEGGTITLQAEAGDTVEVGSVIATIDTSTAGSAPTASSEAPAAAPATPAPVATPATASAPTYATGHASPAAQKHMAESGVSVPQGSGKDGRVTKEDVIQAIAAMGGPDAPHRTIERKKLSALRRKLGHRLVSVKNETAMLTTFNEVDMEPVMSLRSKHKDAFVEKHGIKLGFMSFFTRAVVRALELFPEVNTMIDGNEQLKFGFIDVSIAVSGPKGLMVPVVRDADQLSFKEIEGTIADLATRARDGKITVDEMTGGTFTITNGGVFGSMMSTPILNPPQSAILGMHAIKERPVVADVKGKKEIVIRPMMYLALSYDHRLVDGRESVGFLVEIKEGLESPEELLMDGNAKKALSL